MEGLSPSHLRAQAIYLIYRGLGEAMQRLPERVADAAAASVGLGLTAVRQESRAYYARHIRRVLGPELSDADVRDWTRRAFVHYARYWMEGSRLPAVDAGTVSARMRVESGYEHLVAGMKAGRGVIMALPHLGRWEWGGAWLTLQGYPMTAVAEPVEPPELYDWFVSQREALGLRIVQLGSDSGGVLLRTLRAGGLVGLLCDRDLVGNGVEVEFFGERTTLPGGPATLALRTGAALVPTAVYGGPGRLHTAVILPPVAAERTGRLRADVERVTQEVAYGLETLIRRAPDQWYLFQPNWPSDKVQLPVETPRPAGRAGRALLRRRPASWPLSKRV
ncbi:MAG: phosphatidylinositol mannoside acyltransferase [Acidimicrobiales bacterium]